MSADLIRLVERLGRPRVLVVGDVMLDRYIWGDAERISQEAPVILLRADKREERLGGAGSVATMLRALGADVSLAGVVGDDEDGRRVRRLLDGMEIDHAAVLTDEARPSTVKERYVGRAQQKHPQQMLRVDYETREVISLALETRFKEALAAEIARADVVLVSDYDKGVCTPGLLVPLIEAARKRGTKVLVDPIRIRGGLTPHPFRKYHGCSAMTPNRLEAGLGADLPIRNNAEALVAAEKLLKQFEMEAAIVTLDKDGMALAEKAGRREVFATRQRQVYDITGAGDMVLSVLGLALAAGAGYPAAIRLANIAGGLEVEKIGVAPVTREEIVHDIRHGQQALMYNPRRKLCDRVQLADELARCRAAGRRIAFTNGCFDLLHAGHVQYLHEARAQADVLIVALNSDASVRQLKGPTRPVVKAEDRAEVLAGLAAVDHLVIFDEPTPLTLIKLVRPDVLVKGADYRKEEVIGGEFVESYGGRVHLAGFRDGFSTTGTILKMSEPDAKKAVA